ncbi:unnamed protein product [Closterium sp. NIES-54]
MCLHCLAFFLHHSSLAPPSLLLREFVFLSAVHPRPIPPALSTGAIIGIVVAGVVFVAAVLAALIWWQWRKRFVASKLGACHVTATAAAAATGAAAAAATATATATATAAGAAAASLLCVTLSPVHSPFIVIRSFCGMKANTSVITHLSPQPFWQPSLPCVAP